MPVDAPDALLVFCTFPDEETARQVGATLVEEHLAACVNLNPGITSIYRWEGKVETASEVLAIIKTLSSAYSALATRLQELHPYDVPEILAIAADRGSPAYLQWLAGSVTSRSS